MLDGEEAAAVGDADALARAHVVVAVPQVCRSKALQCALVLVSRCPVLNCIRANWVVVAVPQTRQLKDAVCNIISLINLYTRLCRSKYIYILYNISEYASMVPQALAGVRNLAPALARARFVVVDEVDACFQVGG